MPILYSSHTPPRPSLRGVIFDIDGVLVDSKDSNIAFYNLLRNAVGLAPMSEEEEAFCHMATSQEVFCKILPDHLFEQAMSYAKTIDYKFKILPMIHLQAGLIETLALLKSYDLHLGVFTNRADTALSLLHYFGISDFFSTVRTPLNCPPKPNPEGLQLILQEWDLQSHQILFVGDSLVDQQAADALNVPFCAFGNMLLHAQKHVATFKEFNDFIVTLTETTPKTTL